MITVTKLCPWCGASHAAKAQSYETACELVEGLRRECRIKHGGKLAPTPTLDDILRGRHRVPPPVYPTPADHEPAQ